MLRRSPAPGVFLATHGAPLARQEDKVEQTVAGGFKQNLSSFCMSTKWQFFILFNKYPNIIIFWCRLSSLVSACFVFLLSM